ncbi:MAG: hypothetical protein HYS70_06315 [Nitrospinae bacterium]|nr:hypothetical protein [Nitrospinota bacterium]
MLSEKVKHFTESVIREMTRQCLKVGGVNLAQGFPDFEAPEEIKEAAIRAIRDGVNQYAITWGSPSFREAISRKALRYNGITADPETIYRENWQFPTLGSSLNDFNGLAKKTGLMLEFQ